MQDLNRFIVLPSFTIDLMREKKINASDALVLGVISNLSKKDGFCYASNAFIGKILGFSKGTVANKISSFVKKKLIRIELIRDSSNKIIERKIFVIFDIYPLSTVNTPIHQTVNTPSSNNEIDNKEDSKDFFIDKSIEDESSEKQTSKKQFGKEEINFLLRRYKRELGIVLAGKRRQAQWIVSKLEKRHKNGTVKEGKEWLKEDVLKNIENFIAKIKQEYGIEFAPRKLYKLWEACDFYIKNFGELNPKKAREKRKMYESLKAGNSKEDEILNEFESVSKLENSKQAKRQSQEQEIIDLDKEGPLTDEEFAKKAEEIGKMIDKLLDKQK